MKKFVLLFVGFEPLTPEIHKAWSEWFDSISDKMMDSGNPFGAGREITRSGSAELSLDRQAIAGYSIIKAENMDEAEKIVQGCPIITGVRIYEALSM